MKIKSHDIPSLLLLALVTVLPLIASAPAQYGLSPVVGAWVGLGAAAVGAIASVVLNASDKIGDEP